MARNQDFTTCVVQLVIHSYAYIKMREYFAKVILTCTRRFESDSLRVKFVSDTPWIGFSLFESSSWLLKGLRVGFSKRRSMYFAHKKILFHTPAFIYLLKSLHWRTTGVERVLCCASSVHCEYWPRNASLWRSPIHRLVSSWSCMHVCVLCTWTTKEKLEHFAYKLIHGLRLSKQDFFSPFSFYQTLIFSPLARASQISFFELVICWIVSKHGNFTVDKPCYILIDSCRFLLQTSRP